MERLRSGTADRLRIEGEGVAIPARQFILRFRESEQVGELRCEICGHAERFCAKNLADVMHRTAPHFKGCAGRDEEAETQVCGSLSENLDSDRIVVDAATGHCWFEAIPLDRDVDLVSILRVRLSQHVRAVEAENRFRFGRRPPPQWAWSEPPGTRTVMLAKILLGRLRRRGLSAPKLAELDGDRDVPVNELSAELDAIEELLTE